MFYRLSLPLLGILRLVHGSYESTQESLSPDVITVPPLEISPITISGPSANRINLVFFSDGYLQEEKDKFIQDATRLASDVSKNQTFNSVAPLLNFWAAFTASSETGIGSGGVPKSTPFGLYRDGTELRGVYYARPEVAKAACDSMAEQCNYPILLGNDPFYGGLGGDFTVITSSVANGPLVLRHELGHSMILVGEEYDGGFEYSGVNAAHDPTDIPWSHWLSTPSPRIERSVMPLQVYAWSLLNVSSPWVTDFASSGSYSRHLVRFSLSGLPAASDLKIYLDERVIEWSPPNNIGLDRWHYDVYSNVSLSAGSHRVRFELLNKEREGNTTLSAQLCSVEVLEFGDENEFVADAGYYSVFPTFSEVNETSYRPTNSDCLMRTVTSPHLCKVCIEGLWSALLGQVSLIDNVTSNCSEETGHWQRTIELQLVHLAHLRASAVAGLNESFAISWTKDGRLLDEFANKTQIVVDDASSVGSYGIEVTYLTEEVKQANADFLTSSGDYIIHSQCSPTL